MGQPSEMPDTVDLLVVGGGINGVGVTRDAAGRGLTVMLCERGDLASATSSASSKLIHGGLRYLEYYKFGLVRQSLRERSALLDAAPHIVWPKRFVIPHNKAMRPAWMITLGLFLYDHLARRDPRLPASERIDLARSPMGLPLGSPATAGFVYSDCMTDDSRLVILNARAAADLGATIQTRTGLMDARRENGIWHALLRDSQTGAEKTIRARVIVNAAGPWVGEVIKSAHIVASGKNMRLVKGSHIVVPRLYEGDQAYLLQNDDGRVVFVIPYMDQYSLIGTTEVSIDAPPAGGANHRDDRADDGLEISPPETEYLCRAANLYFARAITAADVVWSYAGIRPLFDDAAHSTTSVTRDYVLDLCDDDGKTPLLSIFGGKLTTYRRLAETVLARLRPYLPDMANPWTYGVPLPGGNLANGGMEGLVEQLRASHPWADGIFLNGLAARHGTLALEVLSGVSGPLDLGTDFGHGLFAREVDYLMRREWARTTNDILWRRTKLGLVFDQQQKRLLNEYLK